MSSGYIFSFVLWQPCAYCLVRISHRNHLVWVSRQHVVTWIPVCQHEHGGDVPTSHPTHPVFGPTNRKTVTLTKCWSAVCNCGLWLSSMFTYKTFVISHQTENWMSSSHSCLNVLLVDLTFWHILVKKTAFSFTTFTKKHLTSTKIKWSIVTVKTSFLSCIQAVDEVTIRKQCDRWKVSLVVMKLQRIITRLLGSSQVFVASCLVAAAFPVCFTVLVLAHITCVCFQQKIKDRNFLVLAVTCLQLTH